MEILAPAGNMDSVYAAVRTGADAVYLGLKDFSARRNADNFDSDSLKAAVGYCHIRGVRVYVTLNTMIKEKEMTSAVDAAINAYNCGADAFIVSDLGLISVLHKVLPEAVLHASTQMTVHSPAALEALKKFNIKRVVLAREMSREQIKDFCTAAKKQNIEVEVFVHGALCMCVSGQCLLSSMLGGRSGNRGLCAGPCRLEFSAKGSGRHDLSLKDLSLIDELKELESIGVMSAKIEGRMKRPEYVAAAVSVCRAALDGTGTKELEVSIKSVFSRSGFTNGYYTNKLGADMFGIRTKDDVLSSKEALPYIHTLYRSERQCIPIRIKVKIQSGEAVQIEFCDNLGNHATVKGDIPEAAQKHAINESDIKTAVEKLGGTPYFAGETKIFLDNGLYVKASLLNQLRRDAVKVLDILRSENSRAAHAKYFSSNYEKRSVKQARVYTEFRKTEQIPENLCGIDSVILPFDSDFSKISGNVNKVVTLPRYITDEDYVIKRLYELKSQDVTTAYCGNLSAIVLAKQAGFNVIASNGVNCASNESLSALAKLGADKAVLSAEINLNAAKSSGSKIPVGIFAYGRLPLMLTKNCPVRNAKTCKECGGKSLLKDRKGIMFPVVCSKGYCEILNSTPIYLGDKQDDINAFDFLVLSFSDESSIETRNILDKYLSGDKSDGNFTRGAYYKNIP